MRLHAIAEQRGVTDPKSVPQPQHGAPVGGGDSDGDSDGSGGRVGTKLDVKA